MFKVIGGVVVGVFLGAMVLEILKRQRPDFIETIEKKAKTVSDKLFNNMRETYDLHAVDR